MPDSCGVICGKGESGGEQGGKGGKGGEGHMGEMGTMWPMLLKERLPSIPSQVTMLMLTTFSSGVFKQDCCPIWTTEPCYWGAR